MSNCVFCNAKAKDGWSDERSVQWFECGTMYQTGEGNRFDQTYRCADIEREKLKARIEALEKAGDKLEDSVSALREVMASVGVSGSMGLISIADWHTAKNSK